MDNKLYEKVGNMDSKIDSLHEKFDSFKKNYVTKEAFTPVRKIVYGFTGLILIGFATILIAKAFN